MSRLLKTLVTDKYPLLLKIKMKITVFNLQKGSLQEKSLVTSNNKPGIFVIGRNPNCDLILNNPEVSRVHGLIHYFQENFYFTELVSTNGSRLNNQDILMSDSRLLAPGDIIQIVDFYLLFLPESEKIEKSNPYWFLKPQNTVNSTPTTVVNKNELIVSCSQIIEETHDVKTFCLVTSPPTKFDYKPGQFVTLDLEINGKSVKRSYSISSTPSRPHNLEITVKRVPAPKDTPDAPPGLVSNWLNDNLTTGSQIKISPPMGNFTCFDNPNRKFLFISAGSGITPMMSMSRWLCDTIPNADIIFLHSAKTLRDVIFHHELELMASRNPDFQLAITLTGAENNSNWLGATGRLNEKKMRAISPDYQERIVYVCGSDGFRASVKAILGELEFPMQNYHEESFGSSKKREKVQVIDNAPKHFYSASFNTAPTSNKVVFTESQQQVVCEDGETILEAAEREGITLSSGCKMGACGMCKLRKISGEVSYEEDVHCEDEYVLTCVAKARGNVMVEG